MSKELKEETLDLEGRVTIFVSFALKIFLRRVGMGFSDETVHGADFHS